MVLDAMEDTLGREEDDDIPLLDRHLARRDFEAPTRVMSKEEILQQRQEMLQEEKEMKKQVTGQLDMYNFKLAEIAHELDKVNINEPLNLEEQAIKLVGKTI